MIRSVSIMCLGKWRSNAPQFWEQVTHFTSGTPITGSPRGGTSRWLADMPCGESHSSFSRSSVNTCSALDPAFLWIACMCPQPNLGAPLRRTPRRAAHQFIHTYIKDRWKDFGLIRAIITVLQSAEAIMGNHATRGYAASSAPRRSLAQSKVRSVLVVKAMGSQPIRTAYRSPWQNGIAERWLAVYAANS